MPDIDMDALLAQREEATGSADTFAFTFAGQRWFAKDPIMADDDWKTELAELASDVEVAEHYLGAEQYERFVEAGGRNGVVLLAVREYTKRLQDEDAHGRPTPRSASSDKRRKR
ncbi:hypothetical protein [Saccharopolyspora rosea]|uniref:hypothetical protein n=1 Tax=Saccharopolyspora rosea TaxID=524884 RepID=UPI0021D9F90E|nr:hypothetical protein [Saccharopolyspora rosea]